ncbi:hypothetical protein BJV82DRAFT_656584 [Fennellomyces sp. T-0311]|nr:hypothetical protein BJV82DRAFT_656584 [Fennellomyces sp. T-0311]
MLSFFHMENLGDFEDQDGFVDLLRHSSLRANRFYQCGCNMDTILGTLAGVDALRHIDLSGCLVTSEALNGFFEPLVKQGSMVNKVGLQAQDEVTDVTLHHIGGLNHLKSVSLSYLDNIMNDGVQPLHSNKQITKQIFGCDQLTI